MAHTWFLVTRCGILKKYVSEAYINILVCLGCYHNTTMGWVAYKQKKWFLTVLEAGKSKIKALADSVSGEGWLPGSQKAVFLW